MMILMSSNQYCKSDLLGNIFGRENVSELELAFYKNVNNWLVQDNILDLYLSLSFFLKKNFLCTPC